MSLNMTMMYSYLFGMIYYAMIPFILYLTARWRDSKESTADPQLGYKFGLNIVLSTAYILILVSMGLLVSTLLFSLFKSNALDTKLLQVAGGLIVPGVLLLLSCKILLRKTNQNSHPSVGRLFSGFLWIVSSIVAISALIMVSQLLSHWSFGSGQASEWAIGISLLLVSLPASIGFGMQVKRQSVSTT